MSGDSGRGAQVIQNNTDRLEIKYNLDKNWFQNTPLNTG